MQLIIQDIYAAPGYCSISGTKAYSLALDNVQIYNPWLLSGHGWVHQRQIQTNIAVLGLEYIKVCDTWLAMEGKLLRYLGQSSRTGDSIQ